MVQEAKPSCRGKWYLPAGRMERNETIVVSWSIDFTAFMTTAHCMELLILAI